ncbi:MAG: DHH family phosphoesterase [Candidatus Micrarchaeota archaeon]|nr:DHH family phosphoesterase [Candidatus Micrarchaeota archaeon]
MGNVEGFLSRCAEAREAIVRMREPLVVHHYDCDGITSGSIVAGSLEKMGKPYRAQSVRKLDDGFLASIAHEPEIIFVDLGSGTAGIDSLAGNVVAIDHHQQKSSSRLQANPHAFGFDGGTDVSAAGCAYFVFREFVELGVVGAIGDIQAPLRSLNALMLDDAVRQKAVAVEKDILLFGRNSRPLKQFLLYADEPYLPGITGQDDACDALLRELGIEQRQKGATGAEGGSAALRQKSAEQGEAGSEKWRTYSDLSFDERRALVSSLAKLVAMRSSQEAASRLVGDTYNLLRMPQGTLLRDASEFSTLLNACGRNSRPELGVSVCLQRAGAYVEAQSLLAEHRRNLRAGMDFASKNTQDIGKFLLLDARGAIPDSIIGVVAGMLYAGSRKKPILALSLEAPGKIKLSTRGTRALVEAGLNLGKILSECCAQVGGAGGGHNIAAGATIPEEKLNDFLKEFAARL